MVTVFTLVAFHCPITLSLHTIDILFIFGHCLFYHKILQYWELDCVLIVGFCAKGKRKKIHYYPKGATCFTASCVTRNRNIKHKTPTTLQHLQT